MLINFVDATNDANHYTKPPPQFTDKMSFCLDFHDSRKDLLTVWWCAAVERQPR